MYRKAHKLLRSSIFGYTNHRSRCNIFGWISVVIMSLLLVDQSFKMADLESRLLNAGSKLNELQPWLACPATFFQKDYCTVYDIHNSNPVCEFNRFPCVLVNKEHLPHFQVCTYNPKVDATISKELHENGIWELEIATQIAEALRSDESLGFLDLGANIGVFSQLAAALGRKVLAVEPVLSNVQRIHRAARYNQVEHQITIVSNPVSNMRHDIEMAIVPDNMGMGKIGDNLPEFYKKIKKRTILAEDLLSAVPFTSAVMKVDIEGEEVAAFEYSRPLLDTVRIPYIFMEWKYIRNRADIGRLIDVLRPRGYQPRANIHGSALDYDNKADWPDDIVWTAT